MVLEKTDRTASLFADDHAIFSAPPPEDDVKFVVDFNLSEITEVGHFVSREELAHIHEVLVVGGSRRTAIVCGPGGVGKTQLAITYARQYRDHYSAVFWLNAKNIISLKQGYARAARRILRQYPSTVNIGVAEASFDLDKEIVAVNQWLEDPRNDNWLIICDNYDTVLRKIDPLEKTFGEDANDTYDINSYLPNIGHGAVLITTRSWETGGILLGKLNVPDSFDICCHASGQRKPQRCM